jgi:uncharacterized protein (TIGR03118 family)
MFRTQRHRPTILRPSKPRLEVLEDRCLLDGNVLQTNLVSDLPGVAQFQDPQLVNPWGIAEGPGGPFWISDNNAGVSTLYNTPGEKQGLVVSIPTPGDPTGSSGAPTGDVFNTTLLTKTPGFSVTNGTDSGPAIFLFATEDGTIVGWNPGVNPIGSDPNLAGTFGTIAKDNSGNNFTEPDPLKQTGAVYKGLTIATDASGQTLLYAANFRSGQVEVYGTDFKRDTKLPKGAFTDKSLPTGYAPFDVQELGGKIYVTYALQNDAKHDDVGGLGHGFIDVFNLDGTPGLAHNQERLVSRGQLDSPWGLALAPSSFGNLAGALLVGNFKSGFINAYNSTTGQFLGMLKDPDGEPIQIDRLWTLKVGVGGDGGDTNTVYFTAGLFNETHGLFGSLKPVAPGTPEGPAEEQAVIATLDVLQMQEDTVLQDIINGADPATLKQDVQTLDTDLVQAIRAEARFLADQVEDGDSTSAAAQAARQQTLHTLEVLFQEFEIITQDLL